MLGEVVMRILESLALLLGWLTGLSIILLFFGVLVPYFFPVISGLGYLVAVMACIFWSVMLGEVK